MFLALLTLPRPTNAQSLPKHEPAPWQFAASATLKETFDSNVYLQDQTPLARRESLLTVVQPQVSAKWQATPEFTAALAYQPEATWFHSEPTEDFVLQRAAATFSGRVGRTSYESATTVVAIAGDSAGPTWTGLGGAPATGGAAVRDRRDAAVYRTSLRLTQELGKWFVRPNAAFYLHDFQTDQRATPGYQNYVDRSEVTAGLDTGRRLGALTMWAGYRYGVQEQARLLQFPEQYDSRFHRILAGWEGDPAGWLKFNLTLGPEFRHFGSRVPTSFGDRHRLNFFLDASLTLLPTPDDTLTLSGRRFEQPGFSGRGVYQDSTYDLCWRHKFNQTWTAGVSGRAYGTAFLKPVQRNDWIFSQSTFLNWAPRPDVNVEISYTHETGATTTPNAAGREYTRHLVTLGLRYNFETRPR